MVFRGFPGRTLFYGVLFLLEFNRGIGYYL